MSGFLVLFMLAVASGLSFVGWFATPKGNQQTYANQLMQTFLETDAVQADPNYDHIDSLVYLSDVVHHIFGSIAPPRWYVTVGCLGYGAHSPSLAPRRSDLRFEDAKHAERVAIH